MITHPKFVIAHIPRTGGDAIKQILTALHLPQVRIAERNDPAKHNVPHLHGRDFILSIRRLPARELSHIQLAIHLDARDITGCRGPTETFGQFTARMHDSENLIISMTNAGQRHVTHYIRMENLRNDLDDVLNQYGRLTDEQEDIIQRCPTKSPLPYNHDIEAHFSHEEIIQLYRSSPTWARNEKRAYGHIPQS